MRELLRRYRHQLLYLFFGVCTTVVNVLVYGLCARLTPLSTAACTGLAWVAAVLLAYATNRTWVFGSRARGVSGVLRELGSFFLCRLATGGHVRLRGPAGPAGYPGEDGVQRPGGGAELRRQQAVHLRLLREKREKGRPAVSRKRNGRSFHLML